MPSVLLREMRSPVRYVMIRRASASGDADTSRLEGVIQDQARGVCYRITDRSRVFRERISVLDPSGAPVAVAQRNLLAFPSVFHVSVEDRPVAQLVPKPFSFRCRAEIVLSTGQRWFGRGRIGAGPFVLARRDGDVIAQVTRGWPEHHGDAVDVIDIADGLDDRTVLAVVLAFMAASDPVRGYDLTDGF